MAAGPLRGVRLVKPSMGKGLGQGVWFRDVTLCLQTDAGSQAQEVVPSVWAVEGTRLSCSQLWTALWLLLAAGWQLGAGRRAGKNRDPQVSLGNAKWHQS